MRIPHAIVALALLLAAPPAQADPPEKWTRYCTKCHGADGKGKTKMGEKLKVGDMTTAEWQKARQDESMKKRVREGNPETKQPGFGPDKLTDEEIAALVAFVRSLGPK